MYTFYRLVTIIMNPQGGASETIEHLMKEVDGVNVPKDETESKVAFFKKLSDMGGSQYVQNVKCLLLDPDGNVIMVNSVDKPVVKPVEE